MTTVTLAPEIVIGGVDTHADIHVAAACDQLGKVLGTKAFPTTPAGYRDLLAFLTGFGEVAVRRGGGHRVLWLRTGPPPGRPNRSRCLR